VDLEAVDLNDQDLHHDDRVPNDLDQAAGAMTAMDLVDLCLLKVTDMSASTMVNVHLDSCAMDMVSARDRVQDHTVEVGVEAVVPNDRDPSPRREDLHLDDQEARAMMDTDLEALCQPKVTDMSANMMVNVHLDSCATDMVSARDQDQDHTVEVGVEAVAPRDAVNLPLDAVVHADTADLDQEAIADRWKKWIWPTTGW